MSASRDDLTPAAVLELAAAVKRRARLAEVEDCALLSHWAAIHSCADPGGLVQLGGEGTPLVQDHCLGEIALARSAGVVSTINHLADVLDLQHRLPRIWARTEQGVVDTWLPRKIAKMSRHLPLDRVHVVDAAIAAMLGHESAGRILTVAEAKIIEADPVAHQEKVEAEKRRRYASLGRSDQCGLRTFVARLDAADAVWIDAIICRVAEIIAPEHEDATADEIRAIAFGYLARPAELLALLLRHVKPDGADAADDHEPEPEPETGPVLNRALAFPADLLDKLTTANLQALAPKIVLYVHLHEAALHGTPGVARVEQLGPRTLTQLQELLAGANVTVKSVIDLNDRVRTTAYEHPEALKERIHLITGGEYWPWATSTSRKVDYDHVTPYRANGPPGQTGTHNAGPLTRRPHRWKTHAGYQARQSGTGRYVWRTPHGLCFFVDHHGSRPIPAKHGEMILNAPPLVDVYPTDVKINFDQGVTMSAGVTPTTHSPSEEP